MPWIVIGAIHLNFKEILAWFEVLIKPSTDFEGNFIQLEKPVKAVNGFNSLRILYFLLCTVFPTLVETYCYCSGYPLQGPLKPESY